MQHLFDRYKDYTSTQFALDDFFIECVYTPTDENTSFWKDYLQINPQQSIEVEKARNILLAIHAPKEKISDDIKNRIWQNIQLATSARRIKMSWKKYWIPAAAAAILITAGAFYFSLEKNNKDALAGIDAKTQLKNDVAPGGNKAVLTLSDGTTIVLDSAQKGTLANQGNARIVKLDDGKLAYQKQNSKESETQINTITTPRGGQYQLELADGSHVWLNAASSITFPTLFTGNKREVSITGEVYFEVAHNAQMPFRVKISDMEVQVLGTHFNIDAYADDGVTNTTLLEGSIKVIKRNESVIIKPGEQAQVRSSTNTITVKKVADIESVIAWKNGKFIFQDEGIQSIMRKLERWYDIYPDYQQHVTDEKFVGIISRDVNLSQILAMLEKTGVVKFSIVGKNVIVK